MSKRKTRFESSKRSCEDIVQKPVPLRLQPTHTSTFDEELDMSLRARVRRFLENTYVDIGLSFVIVANVILMVIETNYKARCEGDVDSGDEKFCRDDGPANLAVYWTNMAFQIFYTIECAVRLFAYRCEFFSSKSNLLDITIVLLGYVDIILVIVLAGKDIPGPGVAILRIFRIARLLRVARILSFFPELYVMIRGFVGAMMAMFWGMFMIACLLLIWSILGVEIIHPVTESDALQGDQYKYCRESFSKVQTTMLIFFQTVFAGDSWGACAIPIVLEEPGCFFIFAGTLITIQLGFTNLVLAVIVERATKATEKDAEERIKEHKAWHAEATRRLDKLIKSVDTDASGTITLDEILTAYHEVPELGNTFLLMGINEHELENMFGLLADDSGHASYASLVDVLEKSESEDMRRSTMLMGLQLNRIRQEVGDLVKESKHPRRAGAAPTPPSTEDPVMAELQAMHMEMRDYFDEAYRGLGETLDDHWSAFERRYNKQAREQAMAMSQHRQMLEEITLATRSKLEEPKDVDEAYPSLVVKQTRWRQGDAESTDRGISLEPTQASQKQEKGITGTGDSSLEAPRKKKTSKFSQKKEEQLSGNAARWKKKIVHKPPPG